MKRPFSAVLLAIGLSLVANAREWKQEPKDFHGVAFGANEEAVRAAVKKKKCFSVGADRMCDETFNIGDVPVIASYFLTNDRMRTVEVTFPSASFAFIRDTFKAKYGDPDRVSSAPWVNRAGHAYPNEILEWRGERVVITLQEKGDRIDESLAKFDDAEWLKKTGHDVAKAADSFR